jgi:hypothetical protein
LQRHLPLEDRGGQGKPGAPKRTRSLACKIDKARERSHHRFAGTPGLPCAMVLTVSFALSPETGLCCLRHRRNSFRRLSASVGAPRPHDFAVRFRAVRPYGCENVHRIPPNVRDDGQRPSFGRDGRSCKSDLPVGLSEIFLQEGLDTVGRAICLPGKSVHACHGLPCRLPN